MVDTTPLDDRPPTILESALRFDRTPAVVLLIVLPLVSWMWIVVMARDMHGPMTGASAWMMTAVWDAPHLALLWAMWAVMMVGMMLPSASPMLLLYGGVARRSATGASAASHQIYALAAGYLVVWAVFSLGGTSRATGSTRVSAASRVRAPSPSRPPVATARAFWRGTSAMGTRAACAWTGSA